MRFRQWRVPRMMIVALLLLVPLVLSVEGAGADRAHAPETSILGEETRQESFSPDLFTNDGVVRGVLFYSPTCPYCHDVIDDVLPPLREAFGKDLILVELDATTPAGRPIWQAAVATYDPPAVGFPTLVIGDFVLIGSRDIPQSLPGLIEDYFAAGGVGWPAIDGLDAVVAEFETPGSPGILESLSMRFGRDVIGSTLSVIVLVVLFAVLIAANKSRLWRKALSE